MIFAIIGIIFFISVGFEVLDTNIASFLGTVFFILAGATFAISGMMEKGGKKK